MSTIDRELLLNKLELAAPALASNEAIPTLQQFLFTGEQLLAYNDRIGIATALRSDFKGVVPGTLLRDVIAILTHAEQIELKPEEQHIAIGAVGKKSAAKLPLMPADIYDQLFKMPTKPRTGYTPDAAFFTAIDNCMQSIPAYASEVERLGITLIPDNGRLLLYASDGATISHARLPGHEQFKQRCTIPLEFCQQLLKLKGTNNKLMVQRDHVLFAADDTLLFGRLLVVDQPMNFAQALKKFLPKSFPDGIPKPSDLERARIKIGFDLAERMTDGAIAERTNITINNGRLKLQSANTTRGEAFDLVAYKTHPDAECSVVMERVMRGFNRYDTLLIRNDVVLQSRDDNIYLVAAMRG